jgi:hypothetical protein
MERFNLKKSNEVEKKSSNVLKSQTGWQLWKTLTLRWILIELGEQLQNIKISAKKSLG